MKVHDKLSEEFCVGTGLRQGCVLSPLLFSLYINGVVTRLHDGKCGVQCGGDMVQACCSLMTRLWLPMTKKG